ncbi:hypothetical protein GNF76_22540 [Pseudomonas sp. CCM 7893]|uniref:Uncharacterized protein n=1 Tax=Pseudomonas spelaei TaxID=1055469 RepID=A0A6I3WA75_9PSED|nr:hypothetical protein [Pseudomonas spelaei]MUF07135.1 hypothetical protein [Pseudomonas spelaei]QLG93424.1 hypothetical protein HZF02_16285 [Pseudomonas yamanorum]
MSSVNPLSPFPQVNALIDSVIAAVRNNQNPSAAGQEKNADEPWRKAVLEGRPFERKGSPITF